MNSIRSRLLVILLSVFVVVWGAMNIFTWLSAEHEIEEVFDAQLAQATDVLFSLALTQDESDNRTINNLVELFDLGQIHEYENKIAFQVWKSDRLILHSKNAPTLPMTSNAGYSDGQIEGVLWRFLLRRDEASGMSVIVAEEYEVRQELVTQITMQQFWPIIIEIPLLILLVHFSVNSGLMPLIELAKQIKNRDVNQLDPISMEHVPNEMETTISNINNLL